MVRVRHAARLVVLLMGTDLLFSQGASAYIDPGTGSYMLQIGIAGLLAAGYMVKVYWKKIASYLARVLGRGASSHDPTGK